MIVSWCERCGNVESGERKGPIVSVKECGRCSSWVPVQLVVKEPRKVRRATHVARKPKSARVR